MISGIIELSIRNRLMVLLLTATLVAAGVWSIFRIRLDAIPDLSDVQVIITTEYPGQNPEVVDQQVTYPLSSALLAVPGAKVVRGLSMMEQSFVYVLFEDGTDISWARGRVLEYLNFARDRLPGGVEPKLGPDATGVGWVYQYALVPGYYSSDHPHGLWHDGDKWYRTAEEAPPDRRAKLIRVRAFEEPGNDPITSKPLIPTDIDLSELRSLQDWYLRFPLTAVEDVAEVASFGGFVKQYQVVVDPIKLRAFSLGVMQVAEAIQKSNNDVGGSVIEQSENEYMVRSRGYLRGIQDLESVPVGLGMKGTPILLGDVATVQIGGEARRGVGELDGRGEVAGGIIVARFGANAHKVIADVKARLATLEDGLPPGVFIKTTYDRSDLINRSIATLRHTLVEEIIVVGLVCILFLLHLRSELVAVFVVPSSVIAALLIMHLLGLNANIMSLGGIAISIGVVVDSAVVMVENGHKHLDLEEERLHAGLPGIGRTQAILDAAREVGPQLFFSLLIITVSFLPVFVLEGEAGRLFKPLAFTKTFAMAAAAFLSITIIPVLMHYFITGRVLPAKWAGAKNTLITLTATVLPAIALLLIAGGMEILAPYRWWIAGGWAVLTLMLLLPQKIIHEHKSPISRILQRAYEPAFRAAMRRPALVIVIALLAMASTSYPISKLGGEFMPPLDEGDLLYMPTTDPSIGISTARELLQQTDKVMKKVPEILVVHGKIGRAETATDPAPLSMIETVARLNPDRAAWRTRKLPRFFSSWPSILRTPLSWLWPETRTITTDELINGWQDADGTMHAGLDTAVDFPGVTNSWTYPVIGRILMLDTGIKTPVGVKIMGPDLMVLSDLAERVAQVVGTVNGAASVVAERTLGGRYLDIDIDRAAAARYGLATGDVQEVIRTAVGGMNIATTVQGPERYPINVRYARDYRDDAESLRDVLVTSMPMADGKRLQVPLGQLATIKINPGAPMIRSENASRTAWVYVPVSGRDLAGFVADARKAVAEQVSLPPGYTLVFAGQYEFWERAVPRLVAASILAVVAIVFLLYMSSRSWLRVGIVMLAVPFSLIGAFWFLYMLEYNLSLAVVIGMIALAGLDAETGMVMLLYLDNSFERFKREGRMNTRADLYAAVHDGAVKRIRPKAMTVAATFIGLLPLLWAEGAGADTMRRIAAPMIGGLLVSFVMELVVYPVVFALAKRRHVAHSA
jgi:copper/silver efflux system protein